MVILGIVITAATVTILVAEFFRARTRPFPLHGWAGLAALAAAEFLMFRHVAPVSIYFTPIAWTAWIFLADAMVWSVKGASRLRDQPRALGITALLSLQLWLIFEAYNLRLQNWTYTGLPANLVARYLGFAWSFMTITPAILETADLVESFAWFRAAARPLKLSLLGQRGMMVAGAVLLAVPLVVPREAGAHLFAAIWLGFIFLLEPANHRLRLPSLLSDLEQGRRGRLYALLVSGWVCGWLWEFWNYWAAAKWIYIFPMFQSLKIFEMPAPGYLGCPPFALECFVMMEFAMWTLSKIRRGIQPAAGGRVAGKA
jgi:hypothetical protein